jgi:hypothetical protein
LFDVIKERSYFAEIWAELRGHLGAIQAVHYITHLFNIGILGVVSKEMCDVSRSVVKEISAVICDDNDE